jgi:hypothetical protein
MVKLLLGLAEPPSPHDAADALAVAICHLHSRWPAEAARQAAPGPRGARSWRQYKPAARAKA